MTKNEFIDCAVGLPWVDRACSFDAMDCWGVVMMYYRHVLNREIPNILGYAEKTTTIASEYEQQRQRWQKLDRPQSNAVFLCFKDGEPCHVGIVLDSSTVLHSMGGVTGQVRIDNLSAIERLFTRVEYYADLLL